jgi:hypothetical protein
MIILADKMLPPGKHGVLISGPQAHLMKLGFENYFLWKARNGYVSCPNQSTPATTTEETPCDGRPDRPAPRR